MIKKTIVSLLFSTLLLIHLTAEEESAAVRQLREWIATKRAITIKQLGGNLSISGEVRTDFDSSNERLNDIKIIGLHSLTNAPSKNYKITPALIFDYRTDNTWAAMKFKFSNNMGIEDGSTNKIKLDRAYLGLIPLSGDSYSLSLEIGRRKLNNIFDSKIEFGSLFDGALIQLNTMQTDIGDAAFKVAAFIVNRSKEQYSYAFEASLLDIANTGFYAKYSFIDWYTKKLDPYKFINSQLVLGYTFTMPKLEKTSTLYSGFLINSQQKKDRTGSYIGFSIGKVRKKGDYAFDINYQWVDKNAILSKDISGIGKGTTKFNAIDITKGNYQGYSLQFLYLISPNVTISQSYAQSKTFHTSVEDNFKYRKYQLSFIYAF